jgi:hypothetical protein
MKPLIPAALLLSCLVPSGAAAKYALAPGAPWTFSVTGTESWNAVVIDQYDNVWMAGNRDQGGNTGVDYIMYRLDSGTMFAGGATLFSGGTAAFYDEGAPSITKSYYTSGTIRENIWLAFTSSGYGTGPDIVTWNVGMNTSQWFDSGHSEFAWALAVVPYEPDNGIADTVKGEPIVAGTMEALGTGQSIEIKYVYYAGGPYVSTATCWSGSLVPVRGRGVALEPDQDIWTVAETAGDILIIHYSSSNYKDSGGKWHPKTYAGFPRRFHFSQAADPRTLVRDRVGNLWVAGALGSSAAVWKFDAAGGLVAGFPSVTPGTGMLNCLALDEDLNAFAVGKTGEDMLVMGVNSQGQPLQGFPLKHDMADAVEGRGIAVGRDRALWIAATVTATGASWTGTVGALFRYEYTPDSPRAPRNGFVLLAPRGAIMDLLKHESMRIVAHPTGGGEIRFQVLTMRGDLVREYVLQTTGNTDVSATWDGRNAAGEYVASGVYAVRVTGGGVNGVKRAMVIKKGK